MQLARFQQVLLNELRDMIGGIALLGCGLERYMKQLSGCFKQRVY